MPKPDTDQTRDEDRLEAFRDPSTGRFLPGNPGSGKGGRPKGFPVSLRGQLKRRLEAEPSKADRILDALEGRALDGDIAALKLYLESHDGLQTQRQEVNAIVKRESILIDPRATADPPPLPEVVREYEEAEERAQAESDRRRAETLGDADG